MAPGTIWVWDEPDYSPYVACGPMEWLIIEERKDYKMALRSSVNGRGEHHISQDTIEIPFVIKLRVATEEEKAELMPIFKKHATDELFWVQKICAEKEAVVKAIEGF